MTTTTRTTNRLDATAGILLIAIAILHAVFTMNAHWPAWIAGELRDGTASTDSFRAFWAQPGGFAVVVALLGLLILRSARRGERLPGYVGWGFLGWAGLCVALVGPASGFTLALVPPVLLIIAHLRGRAADRPYRGAREYVRMR
jgi:hypothetical protein